MRRLANISILVTVLILLLFGTGGLSLMKCSCSGVVSFVLPTDGGCCPDEGGCMTVKVWKVSDADMALQQEVIGKNLTIGQPMVGLPSTILPISIHQPQFRPLPLADHYPPGWGGTSVEVLRV